MFANLMSFADSGNHILKALRRCRTDIGPSELESPLSELNHQAGREFVRWETFDATSRSQELCSFLFRRMNSKMAIEVASVRGPHGLDLY